MYENKSWYESEEYYSTPYYKLDSELDKDSYNDPSVYNPKIAGTELEVGITFSRLNYLPILTSRVCGDKRRFYLFDRFQVMEKREDV